MRFQLLSDFFGTDNAILNPHNTLTIHQLYMNLVRLLRYRGRVYQANLLVKIALKKALQHQ